MKCSSSLYRFGTALSLAATMAASPARADIVLMGSDYFRTIQPTSAAGIGTLAGLPIGPGDTDTRVQRKSDCSLTLSTFGSNCTVSIELVALSLISTANPLVRVRESPTLVSAGGMTMTSDGSGTGGTFASFFDVFFEISGDGGASWAPQGPLNLTSSGSNWTTIEPVDPRFLFVDGPVGDQNANRHNGKGIGQFDFYVVDAAGSVGTNIGPGGVGSGSSCPTFIEHSHGPNFNHCTVPARIPEPASLALAGLALTAMVGLGRRSTRRAGVRAE